MKTFKYTEDDSLNTIGCRIVYDHLDMKLNEKSLRGEELFYIFRETAYLLMRYCSPEELGKPYYKNSFFDNLFGTGNSISLKSKVLDELSSFRRKLDNSVNEDFAIACIGIVVSLNTPVETMKEAIERLRTLRVVTNMLGFEADTNQCARSTAEIRRRWKENREKTI